MLESTKDISSKITESWSHFSKPKKIIASGIISVAVIGIGFSGVMAFSNSKEVLYSNLSMQDAAQIVAVLDSEKIPYKLDRGGQMISLEKTAINQAKIILARENVPKGKYTFEDALNNSMSTTQTEKNAKLHRLKEVELETTLELIESIQKADVSLVIPNEKNSFVVSEQKSKASVVLSLNNQLSNKNIEGVARVVKNSVKNLELSNISIVDTNGNILFNGEIVNEIDMTNKQEIKTKAEQELVMKVANLLEPSYDDVRISPNLVFDFDVYAEAREEYLPVFKDNPRGMIDSEKTHDSSSSGSEDKRGGIPGTVPNGGEAPTNQLLDDTQKTESSEVSEREIEYLNNKIITNLTKDVGSVDFEKSSIGIQVYATKLYYQEEVEKNNLDWLSFKRENSKQNPLEIDEGTVHLIRKATGLKNVAIQGFEKPIFIDKHIKEKQNNSFIVWLLGGFIFVGIMLLNKMKNNKKQEVEIELENEGIDLIIGKDEEKEEDTSMNMEDQSLAFQKIDRLAKEKPEIVAKILKTWLTDEEWGDR